MTQQPITRPPDQQLCQGDLFRDVPWTFIKEVKFLQGNGQKFVVCAAPQPGNRGTLAAQAGIGHAMLLSHDCVIDKDNYSPLAFARVLPMSTCDARMAQATRDGKNLQAFYIPADNMIDESYADFRLIFAMTPTIVHQLQRIASLTQTGQNSLQHSLITYWTRKKYRETILEKIRRFFG